MPRVHDLQAAFNAGELSARLAARLDFAKYRAGMATCRNLIPLPEGGVTRRPGTRFVAEVRNSANQVVLRKFQFNVEQAYVLELGVGYVRFYRHQAQIAVPDTDAAISNGNFDANITGWDDLSTGGGSIAWDSSSGGRLELDPGGDIAAAEQDVVTTATGVEHVLKFNVDCDQGDNIVYRIGTSSGGTQLGSGRRGPGFHCVSFTPTASPFYVHFRKASIPTRPAYIDAVSLIDDAAVEISSPWNSSAIASRVFGVQSADVLYMFSRAGNRTYKLIRYGHTTWSLERVAWQDGPYLDENVGSTTLTPSAVTGVVTITASAVDGINDGQGFLTTDIGRLIRMKNKPDLVAVSDAVWGTPAGNTVTVTSAGSNLPVPAANQEIEVLDHSDAENNGRYRTTETASLLTQASMPLVKVEGDPPSAASGEAINIDLTVDDELTWGWALIVGWTSTTEVTAIVRRSFGSTRATTSWRLGAWSVTTGWPQIGGFFEQRLICAATTSSPQGFWASQTDDFENMSPDDFADAVEDDDAFSYQLSSDGVNAIKWMSAGDDVLVFGTAEGQWIPRSAGIVLTPSDLVARRQTTDQCSDLQPLRISNVILFVQQALRKVIEFAFSFEANGYKSQDMTRLAQHVTKSGIVEMAYGEEPDSVVWAVRADGVLLSMTYRRDEDVVGWARHFLGGNGLAEAIVAIPGADGAGQVQSSIDRTEVWVVVNRTINGQTKRYIEVMEGYFEEGDAQEDAYYADSLITYDGSPATVISGLDHLEGATVKVWADGEVRNDAIVSSGEITLDQEASVVQIGLGYLHRGITLKISSGNPAGTPLNKHKRIPGVTFVLLHSHVFKWGTSSSNLRESDFRVISNDTASPVPLFTGEFKVDFDSGWDRDPRIQFESEAPAPFTLLAISPDIAVNPLS